jgi:hypothetical protein
MCLCVSQNVERALVDEGVAIFPDLHVLDPEDIGANGGVINRLFRCIERHVPSADPCPAIGGAIDAIRTAR